MYKSRIIILFSVIMIVGVWAVSEMRIHAGPASGGGIGPDVIVGDMPNVTKWTQAPANHSAYSVGTTSCNIGDQVLAWQSGTPNHPVISQNLYRVTDDRIEQLGQSWLKHGFFALQLSLCQSCNAHSNGTALGVGCSDPYGSSLNGSQSGLGPKSEVNVTTGAFPMPYTELTNAEKVNSGGRIVVANADIAPGQNSGASYVISSQYVQPEDAAFGNDLNNSSYRKVSFSNSLSMSFAGPTVRMEPPINAWKAQNSDVDLFEVDIPDDGRVIVGVLTTPSGGGFHTEVAIYNLNSHQSVRSLALDHCVGSVSNPGFNDVDYHAEPYTSTDWAPVVDSGEIEWSTETFAQNQNANALRWGTLYSYWCDSDNTPAVLTLGLFRPGTESEISIELTPPVLPGDVNQDGSVNLLDVDPFIVVLSAGDYQKEADMNGDGSVNLLDVQPFIDAIGGG